MSAIGTVLYDDRLGCFSDPPSKTATEFIDYLVAFFKYMQPLMYDVPLYKIYPTKTWKKYEYYADKVIGIGNMYVNKVTSFVLFGIVTHISQDHLSDAILITLRISYFL